MAVPWTAQDDLVVFAAQGAQAFGLQVAASADESWRPGPSDWHSAGSGARLSLRLTEGGPYELPLGESTTVYVFVRNSSPRLASAVSLGLLPAQQSAEKDELSDRLSFRADTAAGRTVLDGLGRVSGSLTALAPGEHVRVTLTVGLPADTPARYLDRTTGVTLRVDAENR